MAISMKEAEKVKSTNVLDIIGLEREMNKVLERRYQDSMKHILKEAYRDISVMLSKPTKRMESESRQRSKEKADSLDRIYTSLIEEFEKLEKEGDGPLGYMKLRSVSEIEKIYGLDLEHKKIYFDIDVEPMFTDSVFPPVAITILKDTEANRNQARQIVEGILATLKAKEQVLRVTNIAR